MISSSSRRMATLFCSEVSVTIDKVMCYQTLLLSVVALKLLHFLRRAEALRLLKTKSHDINSTTTRMIKVSAERHSTIMILITIQQSAWVISLRSWNLSLLRVNFSLSWTIPMWWCHQASVVILLLLGQAASVFSVTEVRSRPLREEISRWSHPGSIFPSQRPVGSVRSQFTRINSQFLAWESATSLMRSNRGTSSMSSYYQESAIQMSSLQLTLRR